MPLDRDRRRCSRPASQRPLLSFKVAELGSGRARACWSSCVETRPFDVGALPPRLRRAPARGGARRGARAACTAATTRSSSGSAAERHRRDALVAGPDPRRARVRADRGLRLLVRDGPQDPYRPLPAPARAARRVGPQLRACTSRPRTTRRRAMRGRALIFDEMHEIFPRRCSSSATSPTSRSSTTCAASTFFAAFFIGGVRANNRLGRRGDGEGRGRDHEPRRALAAGVRPHGQRDRHRALRRAARSTPPSLRRRSADARVETARRRGWDELVVTAQRMRSQPPGVGPGSSAERSSDGPTAGLHGTISTLWTQLECLVGCHLFVVDDAEVGQ